MNGRYAVVRIGCIECGEPSRLVSTHASQAEAVGRASDLQYAWTEPNWTGERNYEVWDLRTPKGDDD